MSYQAVNTVMTRWTHLNDQPIRALLFMAHMAHSDHEPPPYFAGHRALAEALGMDPHHPRTSERVRRVLRTLETDGAIVAGMEGKAGQRRDYALTLDPEKTYRPNGVHEVRFTRHAIEGESVREETYPVQLTAWEPVPRQDPRPKADPPRDMGGDPPHGMGGDLPREMGETPHVTWGPRGTHNHSTSKPPEAGRGIGVPSQRDPGTRAGEDAAAHAAGRTSRKKPSTPLPADWKPTAEHEQKARERGIDLAREAEAFRLHAEAHDRRAVRWNAAFSQWLLNARPVAADADSGTPNLSAWNDYRPSYDDDLEDAG